VQIGPRVAEGAQVLGRIKTRQPAKVVEQARLPCRRAPMAWAASSITFSLCLAGDVVDRLQRGQLAEQINRDDRPGLLGNLRLDQARIDVERRRIDVHEDRPGAQPGDRAGGGEERERRADDLIARFDSDGHQGAQQRIGPAADTDRVFVPHTTPGFSRTLDVRAQDQGLLIEHLVNGAADSLRIGRYCACKSNSLTFMPAGYGTGSKK